MLQSEAHTFFPSAPAPPVSHGPPLRDYQVECIEAIKREAAAGCRRQLVAMPTGCHAVGERVLSYAAVPVAVGDVKLEDILMGPLGQPRRVLAIHRGQRPLYGITPLNGGDPFVVTDNHTLTLVRTQIRANSPFPSQRGGEVIDVSLNDWLAWGKYRRNLYKLVRSAILDGTDDLMPVPPYVLGVLLGDGHLAGSQTGIEFSKPDVEVAESVAELVAPLGLRITPVGRPERCPSWRIAGRPGAGGNVLLNAMRQLGLLPVTSDRRHVPEAYLRASVEVRRELLAGLIDTDGHVNGYGIDFISKSPQLSAAVAYLARSLGMRASCALSEKYCQTGAGGIYHRVSISGAFGIPTRIPRKKLLPSLSGLRKNPLRTGFKVEAVGEGEYVGFSVDGDNRYLMPDTTITHNCGKTQVFTALPRTMDTNGILVIAHRKELLDQAARKFYEADPSLRIEVEQSWQYADQNADVVIASVQTLSREARLGRWRDKKFDLLIVDEAHHTMAESYLKILREFNAGAPDGPLLCGFTATPFRHSGRPLANVYDKIVFQRGIREMMEAGWLCRARAIRVKTETDLRNLKTRMGDFAEGDIARVANTDSRNTVIVNGIEQHAKDRHHIKVFCIDVAHAEALTKQMRERGHLVECITGRTEEDVRVDILRRFESGEIRILNSVGCFTEGWDAPCIDTVVMSRPTKSPILYTQQVGRGMRPHPGKADVLIIDVVDIVGRHSIQTSAKLFGVRDFDALGQDVLEAVKKVERATDLGLTFDEGDDVDEIEDQAEKVDSIAKGVLTIRTVAEAVDLFHSVHIAEEVQEESAFPWIKVGTDRYRLKMQTITYMLESDATGRWLLSTFEASKPVGKMECGVSGEVPFGNADRIVKRMEPDFWRVKRSEALWRLKPASVGQMGFLKKLGFQALPPGLTKGAASDMIDFVSATRAERRRLSA